MPVFKLGSKEVISQTDTNQPVIAGNVRFPAGHVIQVVSQNFTGTASRQHATYIPTFLTKSVSYTHLTLPTNREV